MSKVTYTCFAVPPEGILIGKVYNTGKDEKGYYYSDEKGKIYADDSYISMLFTPIEEPKVQKK